MPVSKCFVCSGVLGMLIKFLNCGNACGDMYMCVYDILNVQCRLVVQCVVDHVQMLHVTCSSKPLSMAV